MASNAHDALFKFTFSQVEHAAGELRHVLPPKLVARIDWSTLALCAGNFVDESLTGRHTDLLFSVDLAGSRAFLYVLFEHQSTSDPLMPFRLLLYMVRIWEAFLNEHPNATRVPVIVPVVLHHSSTGWTAPVSFEVLLDVDTEMFETIAAYVPRFRFVLDDLSSVNDEALRGRAMTELGRLVLWCLRNARSPEDLVRELSEWIELFWKVRRAPNGSAALAAIFRYIFLVNERFGSDELARLLSDAVGAEGRDEVASVADQLREEGWRKGRVEGVAEGLVEGRRQMLLRLLHARFGAAPEAVTTRVHAAELGQLDRWAERMLTAERLTDVFEGD